MLAVDGGRSGIRLLASDGRSAEVGGVGPGGDVVAAIAGAVSAGWREGRFDPVDRAVLGLDRRPADAGEARRLAALVAEAIGVRRVWVTADAVTAHAGALSGGWGVSVHAGTGVGLLALPPGGSARILAGHGPLLGGDGGAAWIGSRGIRAALRAADGLGERTAISERVEARFGPLTGLDVRLHDAHRPVDAMARFAADVLEVADAGDAIAAAIVGEAVRELVLLVAAGLAWARTGGHRSGMRGGAVPVTIGGWLLADGSRLATRLGGAMRHARLDATIRPADGSPLDGALRLGLAGEHPYGDLVVPWDAAD